MRIRQCIQDDGQSQFEKSGCIVCLSDSPYPVTKEVYAIPLKTVGS